MLHLLLLYPFPLVNEYFENPKIHNKNTPKAVPKSKLLQVHMRLLTYSLFNFHLIMEFLNLCVVYW